MKVISLNACFQDPWAPLTGGVVPAFEPVEHAMTRIAAVIDVLTQENPVVFLGQEFDNLGAQDECIRLMQQKGYHYFLRDLGSNDPIRNHSGLFVASQVPLRDIQFVPYPIEDRAGAAKWSGQGALAFTLSVNNIDLTLVNVHLNYGEGEENQAARNRQLTRHVAPLLTTGSAALFGDLNCNTASVGMATFGLSEFVNALGGQVTCSDEGKHTLRGKSKKDCADCEERIDGLIYDPDRVEIVSSEIRPLKLGGHPLSDHYAIIATLMPS